jgi:hypothetical protein
LLINPLPWHGGSSASTWIQVYVLFISCSGIFRMFLASFCTSSLYTSVAIR